MTNLKCLISIKIYLKKQSFFFAIMDFWSAQNFYRKIQRFFSHIPIWSYDENKHYGDGPHGSVISYNKLE
jgi:hypothetical protein